MNHRWKGLVALVIQIRLIGISVPYVPAYLIGQSHHALSPKAAFLPVVFIAVLSVGLLLGLWLHPPSVTAEERRLNS
ncbi:protein of unknown function [Candidatus Hydrogenisulfobacillus filiaventi]|uniref:Uncharacterized protein n=1 Tax=Candidatus Hydrogenisulfobacillus filiaventi TaxID=2707344 RepID=A0A6F8ZDN7_9FIRM|nr:protein of unknown function [Candidatus Hydrogenisulfobacillus filiaventi]